MVQFWTEQSCVTWAEKRPLRLKLLLELIESLETYLHYTDEDLDLKITDSTGKSIKLRDSDMSDDKISFPNGEYLRKILLPLGWNNSETAALTAFKTSVLIQCELRILEHYFEAYPTTSLAAEDTREIVVKLVRDCAQLEREAIGSAYSDIGVSTPSEIRFAYCKLNRPYWETLKEQSELFHSDDLSPARTKVPYSMTTTVLKMWKSYFALLNHMNHPVPTLSDFEYLKYPSQCTYRLVCKYWEEFGFYY